MSGIYIHIPFCKQACHYCDFHFSTSLKKKDEMLDALVTELQLRKEEMATDTIETIYFGGGTPSVLQIDEIEALLEAIRCDYSVSSNPEITLEANPDDLDKEKIKVLSESSINRLSIGIQSFFNEDLKLMNRAHNASQAEHSIREAQEYFENISIDLIYGIPGLTDERWNSNIDKALTFLIPHISSYALTVEPKTALQKFIEKGLVADVDDAQAERQFYQLVEKLENQGFVNYEISNFGKESYFSKNNTAYWQGKSYLGIGPSAHSFDGKKRWWNVRNNSTYIKSLSKKELPSTVEILTVTDRYNEYVMTGLRTIWGVSLTKIESQFGANYRKYLEEQSKKYIEERLLYFDGDILRASKKTRFLVDGIASHLFMINL